VPQTDAELTARIARGDSAAFQLLYERHWSAVYRFAWILAGSVADAEDITQECFLALIRRPAFFDPNRAQLRTWLIAIARNQHLQRRRNLAREDGSAGIDETIVLAALDEDLIRLERADAVRRAVDALPQHQREALYLFEFEGLSLADIAVVLEIEPNAVQARLFRARERLKRLLAPFAPAADRKSEEADAR
jgi:RNA polymerase sigma-70 factor, ECF subfamily